MAFLTEWHAISLSPILSAFSHKNRHRHALRCCRLRITVCFDTRLRFASAAPIALPCPAAAAPPPPSRDSAPVVPRKPKPPVPVGDGPRVATLPTPPTPTNTSHIWIDGRRESWPPIASKPFTLAIDGRIVAVVPTDADSVVERLAWEKIGHLNNIKDIEVMKGPRAQQCYTPVLGTLIRIVTQ